MTPGVSLSGRRRAGILLCLLPALYLGAVPSSVRGENQTPPVEAPPPVEKGLFRAILSPQDYELQLKKYDADRLSPEKVAASKLPDRGVVVRTADEGGAAAQAGMTAGWIIVSCNHREIWHHKQALDPQADSRDIEAISRATGESKTFHFAAGKLGFNVQNWRRPEQAVLREARRGAWDADLLAAAVGWDAGDFEFAETALAHANAKGMPESPVANYYAALIWLERGDNGKARKLLDATLKAVTKDGGIPPFYRFGVRTLAFALHDYELLKKASAELAGLAYEVQPEEIDAWVAQGAAKMKSSLLGDALARAGDDVMARTVPANANWEKRRWNSDSTSLARPFSASCHNTGYQAMCFTGPEPLHDVIWEMKGMYTDNEPLEGDHQFEVSLIDPKRRSECGKAGDWSPDKWRVACLRMTWNPELSRFTTVNSGIARAQIESQRAFPRLSDDDGRALTKALTDRTGAPNVNPKHQFDVKLIRMGKEVEIIVNGLSYLHQPIVGDVDEVACEMMVSGYDVVFLSSTLKPIKP